MRTTSKGYSRVVTPLFDTMLVQPQGEAPSTSPSRITSSPSLSSYHTPPRGYIPGSDEGRLKHDELMELVTKLSDRVVVVEEDLKQTKKTYSTILTKLVLKVKKLEKQVRTGKARRRARIVLSEDEDAAEDPSKQGRKIAQIDTDPTISLVQDEGTSWFQEDVETREKNSTDIEVLLEEETLNELIKDLGSGEKGEKEISTTDVPVSTADAEVSTASHDVSTAAAALVYIRRSASKDKGHAIMQEPEPLKKLKKRFQVQMSVDEELARKVQEEEQVKAMAEQEQERINFEAALELQRQFNEKEENRPYSVAEVRKNMVMYLKNQAGYKQSYFKGMKYEEIRPIFEKVWDQTHTFVPMDSEDKEKDSEKKGSRKKSLARKRASEKQSEEKKEFAMDIESLATKYPIVDWKTHVLTENFMYYQIFRADGSFKNYKIFSEMLDDFDRQDVLDLHRLVKARYMTSSPEGYDLMLWGDLKILFEPDEEDEVWKNQHEYNLISWRLFDSCGIHILLMNNGIAIHMMTEKKYPLNQEMLSRMLSKRLEVDLESTMAYQLLKFIKSQVQK
ncbi:hypothetical protein Tco_0373100 [Tanacetum coccineum]